MAWYPYRPYVSVAKRRASAARELAKRRKKGVDVDPVSIEGRTIARSFWGKGWCDHLESYSDYASRLPRGRTYVRNGSVLHLRVEAGRVEALVQGSSLYEVTIEIAPLAQARWKEVVRSCSGAIDSLVDLLRGRLSDAVMRVVSDRARGLFPAPSQIRMQCSCPDWAQMCKHLAAVLYGVGARLDDRPELLFVLRQVDHLELLSAGARAPGPARRSRAPAIAAGELADVFGIELEDAPSREDAPPSKATRRKGRAGGRRRADEGRAAPPKPPERARSGGRGRETLPEPRPPRPRRAAIAGLAGFAGLDPLDPLDEVAARADRIVALLRQRREGLRAEQIRAELKLQAQDLPRPIAAALASGRVRKTGQARGTVYVAT